ncbi:hemolysin-III related-domain-containing protein [Lipomyces arxii]|uniref:hemolysin-III related-domain-containing protein n=1 Tax=Lipomyces arxii TaxID=56418 RepID=UPI0034CFD34D
MHADPAFIVLDASEEEEAELGRPLLSRAESFSMVPTRSRRHSFSHSKKASTEIEYLEEIILLKLDLFLSHLEQRLISLESYGAGQLGRLDDGLIGAHQTLIAVKEACGKLGGEVIGEGWRRGEAIVSILERRYNESLADRESLPSKVAASMRFLEQKLSDIESQCYNSVDERMRSVDATLSNSADAFNRSVEAALKAAKSRLITYEELPLQWRENPYIYRGYRFCANYTECLVSMGKIHNETCNIWTHGLGFIMMLCVALYCYPASSTFQDMTKWDKVVFAVFLIAALKCLLTSTIWHTFNSIGILTHKQRFACVDYTGISILIACSILTTQYTSFYCQPGWRTIYMTSTSFAGLAGAAFAWHSEFDKPSNRWLRITIFVGLAASGMLSMLHVSLSRGFMTTMSFYFPIVYSLLCYIVGVVLYGLLFPERYFPGTIFDWIGMSHNLWHLAVLGGIYFHYAATHKFLHGAREFSCTA